MELLEPGTATRQRVADLLAAGYEYVDGWSAAAAELDALAALPEPPAGVPASWSPGGEPAIESLSTYVVWPWRRTVARLPHSELFHTLRTARNRHLISEPDQQAWSTALIGVAGLSVGSAAVTACQLTGARRFRLADGDRLGLTNLNRISDAAFGVGVTKTELARRAVLECDPFAAVSTREARIEEDTAEAFLIGSAPGDGLSVLIEEIDGLFMKVALRRHARRLGIPVVMATDLGDDVAVDVERFDLDRDTPILGGRLDAFTDDELRARDPRTTLAATRALLADVVTPRLEDVVGEVGRSLNSWPQLGTTAMISGALAAFVARRIVGGHDLASGRYVMRIGEVFPADPPALPR